MGRRGHLASLLVETRVLQLEQHLEELVVFGALLSRDDGQEGRTARCSSSRWLWYLQIMSKKPSVFAASSSCDVTVRTVITTDCTLGKPHTNAGYAQGRRTWLPQHIGTRNTAKYRYVHTLCGVHRGLVGPYYRELSELVAETTPAQCSSFSG